MWKRETQEGHDHRLEMHEWLKLLAVSDNGRSRCNVLELRKKKLGPDNNRSL